VFLVRFLERTSPQVAERIIEHARAGSGATSDESNGDDNSRSGAGDESQDEDISLSERRKMLLKLR
jgi:hypothetical protein